MKRHNMKCIYVVNWDKKRIYNPQGQERMYPRMAKLMVLSDLYIFWTFKILLNEGTTCLIGKYLFKMKEQPWCRVVWKPHAGGHHSQQMEEPHVPFLPQSEGSFGMSNTTEGNTRLLKTNKQTTKKPPQKPSQMEWRLLQNGCKYKDESMQRP